MPLSVFPYDASLSLYCELVGIQVLPNPEIEPTTPAKPVKLSPKSSASLILV